MIVPDELIDPINRLQQNMFISAPTISQTAALSCWDDSTRIELDQHVAKYAMNRAYIVNALQSTLLQQGCTMAPCDGGFYVYIDLGMTNVSFPTYDSVSMCTALLEECHVAFTPGIDFEDPTTDLGRRRFRISYSQGPAVIQLAIHRFVHTFWPTWVARIQQPPATVTATRA